MYHFSYFKENDRARLFEFMDRYPLAYLSTADAQGKPVASQIPLIFEERDGELYLQGHMMRHTDHHRAFEQNARALAVFTGPNAYVSASCYSQPQMGSTWNYMSVHVSGTLRFLSDDELIQLMRMFTLKFEQGDMQSPTYFDNLPEAYLKSMLGAIVGFEIKADNFDNVFKLSQNRDELSYQNIINKLEVQGGLSAMVAEEMKKRHAELFPAGQVWDASKFDS